MNLYTSRLPQVRLEGLALLRFSRIVLGILALGATSLANAQIEDSLVKTFTDDPVPPGGTTTLEFTITNFDRTNALTDISFSDDLDAALSGLMATGVPLSDICGPGSMLSGTSVLTLSGGNLAPEASCTFSISLAVPAGAAPGSYTNVTSPLTGNRGGSPVTLNAASDDLVVQAEPVLSKEFIDDPVAGGDTVTMEFTITNTSTVADATDIAFNDSLDQMFQGITVQTAPANGFCGPSSTITTGGPSIAVNGASLAAGASCTFLVTLQLPVGAPSGTFANVTSPITATVDGEPVTGDAATDALLVVAAPRLTKEFTDDPVLPGDTATLQFTIAHEAEAAGEATDIGFTDDLDAALPGLQAVGLPLTDVCGVGSSISGTSTLTFTGGSLMPGEDCTFSVTLQVPAAADAGFASNTTSVLQATVLGIATESPAASDDLLVSGLVLSKAFTDDPVLPGGTVTLEFMLDNTGNADATNIQFTDNLEATLSGLTASGMFPMADVCGARSSLDFSGSTLVLSNGSVPAGTSCVFSVSLDVPPGAAEGRYANFTSDMAADIDGTPVVLPGARDDLDVVTSVLEFSKSFTDDPVSPGDTVTLEFVITNTLATEPVTDITFTDDLDAALDGLEAAGLPAADVCGAGSTLSGTSAITLTGGNLAPAASCNFSVPLQVPGSAALGSQAINQTSIPSGMAGGVGVSGPIAEDTLVIHSLALSKSFDSVASPTGTVELTFTIDNLDGGAGAFDLAFTDDLDAVIPGLVAVGLPASNICGSGSELSGASVITLTAGSLGPSGSCTFSVTLSVPDTATPGSFPNITSELFSGGLSAAAPAADSLVIESLPVFSKQFAPASILFGTTSTLAFTIDNTPASRSADNLSFVDNLPAALAVASPANASTDCTGGTLTANAGSGTISYTGGSVAAGASCTVQVDVVGNASGMHLNTSEDLTSSHGNSGPASDTLTVGDQPPSFTKQFNPATIDSGAISTVVLTIDNSAASVDATGLDVTDTLPAGLVVANPAGANTSCTAGTLTAVAGAGSFSYSGGTIGAGASCTVQVDVTSSNAGSYVNTTDALTSSLGSSGTATDTLVVSLVAPAFSKAFAPSVIGAGGVSTLSFTIDNTANGDAVGNLAFADDLPAGIELAATPNAASSCGGTVTASAGAGTISFSGGTVSAGASCTVQADITAPATGTFANISDPLTSDAGDSGTASATLIVSEGVVLTKTFLSNPVVPGATTDLEFTLVNASSSEDATDITFSDDLDAALSGLSPVSVLPQNDVCGTGSQLSAGGSTLSLTGGSLMAGASCTFAVSLAVPETTPPASYTNTTSMVSATVGGTPFSSDPAMADLVVEALATFSKTFAPSTVAVGNSSTLTFTIDNRTSTQAANDLSFTDDLPAALAVDSPSNASASCTGGTLTAAAGGQSIAYAGGSVAAGATCTVQVDVVGNQPGTHLNTSSVLTSSLGTGGTASDELQVVIVPVLTKIFASSGAPAGEVIELRFTLRNPNQDLAASDIAFTDDLDAVLPGLRAVGLPASGVCGSGSSVTGTSLISFSGGSLAAGASCTFAVTVAIPVDATPGDYTNVTSPISATVAGVQVQGDGTQTASGGFSVGQAALPVPTLGAFGLLLMIGLMLLVATRRSLLR